MKSKLSGISVDEVKLISVTMRSGYTDAHPGETLSSVELDVGDRNMEVRGGDHTMGVSLRVSINTTEKESGHEVFSATTVVGCTTRAANGESDDQLAEAAVETCIGYARTVISALSGASLVGMTLSFPVIDASDIMHEVPA